MLGNTTSSIEQLICTIAFGKPRTFYIGVFVLFVLIPLIHCRRTESLFCHIELSYLAINANHVLIELCIIHPWIAPHNPCLTIVVNHDGWVYMVPFRIGIERFADSIAERSCRRIADSNTYRHSLGVATMGADVPIELTIALNTL